jgi:hypothetical protein
LSRSAITDELRGRQGFDGLVVTDSLGMGAIVNTTPQDEAAERAILAGADIALVSGTDGVADTHARLTEAITEQRIPGDQVIASVRRVLAAKGIEGECVDVVAAYSSRLQASADAAAETAPVGRHQHRRRSPREWIDRRLRHQRHVGLRLRRFRQLQQRHRCLGQRRRGLRAQPRAASTSSANASSANGSELMMIRCCAPASR